MQDDKVNIQHIFTIVKFYFVYIQNIFLVIKNYSSLSWVVRCRFLRMPTLMPVKDELIWQVAYTIPRIWGIGWWTCPSIFWRKDSDSHYAIPLSKIHVLEDKTWHHLTGEYSFALQNASLCSSTSLTTSFPCIFCEIAIHFIVRTIW